MMTYDASGNMLTKEDDMARRTTWTYNSFNEPLTVEDADGVTTTNRYDANGLLMSVSTPCSVCPSGTTRTTTYNLCEAKTCTIGSNNYQQGDVESVVDPDGKTWLYAYDTYGYRTATTDPVGDVATSTYNADGWVVTKTSPNGNVSGCSCSQKFTTIYSYTIAGTTMTDEFGDIQTVTGPLGHVTAYTYNPDRDRTSMTDPDGNKTTYVYDVDNEQTIVGRPDETTLITDYNNDGKVMNQINGARKTLTTFGYDPLSRVSTVTNALNETTTYSYDPNGNLLTVVKPCGTPPATCTAYRYYDADNELTSVYYGGTGSEDVKSIVYDKDGQRTGLTDATGTSTWSYDSLDRLTSYTNGDKQTVSYTYDLRGLPLTIGYPGGNTATYTYDDAGRMSSVKDWLASPDTTVFGYDADSNLLTTTFQSGVVDTNTYNDADQLVSISDVAGSTTVFAASYLPRYADGQLATDSSVPASMSSYKYTPLNQVCYGGSSNTSACSSPPGGSEDYTYDHADNLTTDNGSSQQFNAADELCWTVSGTSSGPCDTYPSGSNRYTYDGGGNRTSYLSATGSATCYTYNLANRLTSIETGSGGTCSSPTVVASYTYDGTGLRQSETQGTRATQFLWDESGTVPLLLEQSTKRTATYYVYGVGGQILEQIAGSSGLFDHTDQIGSVRAVTDSSGHVQATYTYTPYRTVESSSNPGNVVNPFGFQGQYSDSESAFQYDRARYYDPTTGQFLNTDPLVALTHQPYGYADDNPLNLGDPTGMDFCSALSQILGQCGGGGITITVIDTTLLAWLGNACGVGSLIPVVDAVAAPCAAGTAVAQLLTDLVPCNDTSTLPWDSVNAAAAIPRITEPFGELGDAFPTTA